MNLLVNEISLLESISALNRSTVRDVSEFMLGPEKSKLGREYDAAMQKRDVDLGFNIFAIVSDLYFRENFHSDILRVLIDPKGSHKHEEKYFHLFIAFLCSQGAQIDPSEYSKAEVVREEGRLDVLIKDQISKKAIIVENKINNAGDMLRQIPRYLAYVQAEGYTCDAIVYLRLNGKTGPDTTGWTVDECRQVSKLLRTVCAYDETENDLLNGWIVKCEQISEQADAKYLLRQYGALIKKLGGNVMNKPIMEKFYNIVRQDENLKTALSLKAMVEDLVLYRVEKIIDIFRNDMTPFRRLANYQNYDAYFTNLIVGDAHFGLDIVTELESYSFEFWDRNDKEGKKGRAMRILEKMNCVTEYVPKGGQFAKTFHFPTQEEDLYEHIRKFKNDLSLVTANGDEG